MTKHTWFHDPRLDRSLAEVLTLEQVGNLNAAAEAPTGASRPGRSRRRAVLSAASLGPKPNQRVEADGLS